MSGYRNILVTTDFSDNSVAAIEAASELSDFYQAAMTLLHVIDHAGTGNKDEEQVRFETEHAQLSLSEIADKYNLAMARLEVVVTPRAARHGIINYVEENGIDLVVIATHGHHGVSPLLGTTADRVVHNAPCDVLAIRS
jgi:universal stress protein A